MELPGGVAGTSWELSMVGWSKKCYPMGGELELPLRVAESPLVPKSEAVACLEGELGSFLFSLQCSAHVPLHLRV